MRPFVLLTSITHRLDHVQDYTQTQCEWHRMTRMTGSDCAVMCSLTNTHKTQITDQEARNARINCDQSELLICRLHQFGVGNVPARVVIIVHSGR